MVKNLFYSQEGLFQEIAARAQEEGVNSSEAWDDLVEQIIEEHREVGEFDDDEDLEALEDELKGRYREYESQIQTQ